MRELISPVGRINTFYFRLGSEILPELPEVETVCRGLSEYLESYYGGFGEKIRKAETLLMNEKRISIQAVVKF